jgi:hypothetical protein
MPNTLAEPWTWKSVPEWEKSVLQILIDELPFLSLTLKEPSLNTSYTHRNPKEYWYGMEVKTPKSFTSRQSHLANVFCYEDKIRMFIAGSGGEYVYDLAHPKSIDMIIDKLKHLV